MKRSALALLPGLIVSSVLVGCGSEDITAPASTSTASVDEQGSATRIVDNVARHAFGSVGKLEPASRAHVERLLATDRTLYSRKYFDRNNAAIVGITSDSEGRTVDRSEALAQEHAAYRARYGAFSKALAERVARLPQDSNESIPVMLWLDESSLTLPEFPKREVWSGDAELHAWKAESERVLNERRRLIEAAAHDLGIDELQSHAPLPVAVGLARGAKLLELKHDARVSSIEEIGDRGSVAGDLADAASFMRLTGAGSLHASGYQGSGVNAGIWHPGYPNFTNQLSSPTYRSTTAQPANEQHLAYMIASVRNGRTTPSRGTGFAPSASVRVANFDWLGDYPTIINNAIGAYNWARDAMQTPVLNQSWHLEYDGTFNGYPGNEQTNGDQTYLDRLLDYGAFNYPYVLPIQAAGNINVADEFVNHKGWNSLVVGQDLQAAAMAPESCFRNGNAGNELPNVTAGVDDTMSMFENPDGSPVVTASGGTSVAAALMTGFAASVISADPILTYYPEVLRAVIMASAKNVVGQEMQLDWSIDQQDGAGRPDGVFARMIARNRTNATSGLGAAGYQIASFGATGQSRSLSITTPAGHLKVAISWFAKVSGANFANASLSDLDLRINDSTGNTLAYSVQGDEPAEVIGIDVPAGTYTLQVSGYAVSYDTIFGLAWVTQ